MVFAAPSRDLALLQLQTQYLLYSHQALRERCIEVEKRLGKLQKHEAAAKRKTQARKERIRSLAAEAQAQDDVLHSYHAMLEVDDPALASRLAWTDDGRIVERDAVERDAWVKLLRWDGHRDEEDPAAAAAAAEREGGEGEGGTTAQLSSTS